MYLHPHLVSNLSFTLTVMKRVACEVVEKSFSCTNRETCVTYTYISLLETASLPRAWGPRQRPINPRQMLCRGRPSAKSSRGILSRRRGSLPRALYRALGKAFAEGWSGTRQRKAAVTAPAPGTESLPRAVSRALGKELFFFFLKNLCWGLPRRPSAKKF